MFHNEKNDFEIVTLRIENDNFLKIYKTIMLEKIIFNLHSVREFAYGVGRNELWI